MSLERNAALRRYVDLKNEVAELDSELKEKKALLAEEMLNVHELLRKDGTRKSITVDLGEGYGEIRFTPGETRYADVYDEPAFKRWIEENHREAELFFPDKLRKAPLNEMVKEISEHENAQFPPGLGYSDRRKVTVTRVKKKS